MHRFSPPLKSNQIQMYLYKVKEGSIFSFFKKNDTTDCDNRRTVYPFIFQNKFIILKSMSPLPIQEGDQILFETSDTCRNSGFNLSISRTFTVGVYDDVSWLLTFDSMQASIKE